MKLTKESLKQIIKEELEAVMNEQVDGRGFAAELQSAGAMQQNPQRSENPGAFDMNNSYIAFDDGERTRVYFLPPEMEGLKDLLDQAQKFGFRRKGIAIRQSNYGPPKEYLDRRR